MERRAGSVARAVRAGIAVTDVDIHTRLPNQHGSGAVPPHARPSELSGDLAGAPQRALGRVGADNADRLALARLSRISGGRQHYASTQPRGPTRPYGSPRSPRGRGRGRKPRKDQGERPAVPASATPARPPRPGNRGGDRCQCNACADRCEHGGDRDGRAQPPQQKTGHDEHGDQGSSPQERRTCQRSPASSESRRPSQAPRPGSHLEDVLPQADAGTRRERPIAPISVPQGQMRAHAHGGSARRHTQDGPTAARRKAEVLSGDGGARQRHISRAPD